MLGLVWVLIFGILAAAAGGAVFTRGRAAVTPLSSRPSHRSRREPGPSGIVTGDFRWVPALREPAAHGRFGRDDSWGGRCVSNQRDHVRGRRTCLPFLRDVFAQAERFLLSDLRRAPKSAERWPVGDARVTREEGPHFVQPDAAANARVPAHAMTGGAVGMEVGSEQRARAGLHENFDELYPEKAAPCRHVAAGENLMLVVPALLVELDDGRSFSSRKKGVQRCGVTKSVMI